MRVSVARTALAAAGLAVISLVGSASAAAPVGPKTLSVTDPKGDSLSQPGDDLVKMTYTTTGTGTGSKYVAKTLVVTLETAGGVGNTKSLQYDIEGTIDGCGDFYAYTSPGSALLDGAAFGSCADDDAVDFSTAAVTSTATTVTFSIPLGSVTGFKAGAKVTNLVGYVGIVDPVTGEVGPALFGSVASNDDVATDQSYTIG